MKVDVYENKSINDVVRLNFFYEEQTEDKYLWELLEGIMDIALKNNHNLQKKLLKYYVATIKFDQKSFGNKNLLYIQIANLNKKYTMNNESVTLECANILFDYVSNMKKYLKTVTVKEYASLIKEYNRILEKSKGSIYEFLYEKIEPKEITLDNISLQKVIDYADRIFNNSAMYLQVMADKDVANEVLEKIDFKSLENVNYIPNEVSFNCLDFDSIYNEGKSTELSTEMVFLFQRQNLKLDSEIFTKNQLLSRVISLLVFNIVREENSLSYNPNSQFNSHYNIMCVRANFHEKNKQKVLSLMAKTIKNIEDGDFDDKLIDYAKIQLGDMYNIDNYDMNRLTLKDASNELYGYDFDLELMQKLTKQDIIEHLKTFKLKLIYYLGGR